VNDMKISVSVPVYNTKPQYIAECIESILGQMYKPHELIVVNDGSTDKDTLAYLKEISDMDNIRVINQENKKISGALNTGIKNITGDWWAGLSSDDMWYPHKLKDQVEFVEGNDDIKVVCADWNMIDQDGHIVRRVQEPEFKTLHEQQQYLRKCYFGMWSNLLIHKSVFEKVGYFNEGYPTCEDYEWIIRASQYYRFHRIAKPLAMYRTHPGQLTNTEWGYAGDKGKHFQQKAVFLANKMYGNGGTAQV